MDRAAEINSFLEEIIKLAGTEKIFFLILSGYDEKVDLDASDIDILFTCRGDLRRFSDIVGLVSKRSEAVKCITRRRSRDSDQWIFACGNVLLMLDLSVGLKYHHFNLLGGKLLSELIESGLEVKGLAKFLKRNTAIEENWLRIPKRIYSLQKNVPAFHRKMIYILSKFWVAIRSLTSQKSGVFAVFLGVDGSGKSSVINQISEDYYLGKRKVLPIYPFHWKPGLSLSAQRSNGSINSPHLGKPYNIVVSVGKIFYLFIGFWLGYLTSLLYPLHRGFIVLGDRYFHDLIVDPKRYRYGGPIWLPGFVSRFVPLPDVVFLLDLPVDLAVRRKQEISKDDIRYGGEMGYILKLLAIGQKNKNGRISLRVHPSFIAGWLCPS